MGKNTETNSSLDCLVIKTGIPWYKFIFSLFSFYFIIIGIFTIKYNDKIIIFLIIGLALLPLIIFIDKLVVLLHLPTNYLYVTKDEFVLKKRKKQLVFKINEIKYSFHPFYESFDTPSLMQILHDKRCYWIYITKKQFESIEQILNSKEEK